jgi:hypothetical protein
MIDGAMNTPEPIMEPTINVVAEKTPRRRSSVAGMPTLIIAVVAECANSSRAAPSC